MINMNSFVPEWASIGESVQCGGVAFGRSRMRAPLPLLAAAAAAAAAPTCRCRLPITIPPCPLPSHLARQQQPGTTMAAATGAAGSGLRSVRHARDLAAAPSGRGRPALLTHVCCPYAQRALMALLHKGLDFDLVQVDLSAKPGWYRSEVNPRGLVPAARWQGRSVVESVDIVRCALGCCAVL